MRVGSLVTGRTAVGCAAIAASLCGGLARAQTPPATQPPSEQVQIQPPSAPGDTVGAMVGAWEFSNADHDKICRFNFRADAVPGGYRLDIDRNCPNVFPSTKDIVAWAVDNYGSLRLLDARGNAVVEMTEVESGMYDGFTPEEGRYILQTAAAVPAHSADDMTGDWGIARGAGKPICTLTLSNSSAGGGRRSPFGGSSTRRGWRAKVTSFKTSSPWRASTASRTSVCAAASCSSPMEVETSTSSTVATA